MNIDRLTANLVHILTGYNINSTEGKRAVQKAKYTFTYEKCTSTSEKEVIDSIRGLIEKATIKGNKQIAQALDDHTRTYLDRSYPIGSINTNQSILKYDMLRLLLCLSSSANQSKNYLTPLLNNEEKVTLTWEDVIKDDPLEGDHWKTWSEDSSNDDYSDDDGYEFEERNITTRPENADDIELPTTNARKINNTHQMKFDDRGDNDALQFLLTQQYWRDEFKMEKEDRTNGNLLQNPCRTFDAIGEIYYRESELRQIKTIAESGITREIISLLRGYRGVLFKYIDGRFKLDELYLIQHLSQNALYSILDEFCMYGNIISELRQISTRIANDVKYGQTSQAFAATIYKSLMNFEGKLSELESNTSFITHNPNQSISVLKLRNDLNSSLQSFKMIHEITMNVPFPDEDPRLISIYLISTFYDRALISQSSGQLLLYDTLLYILEQLLIPYGRIIDDWIFYGSLVGDKSGEFFVSPNQNVHKDSPNFWINRFNLESVDLNDICFPCPLFDPDNMARIFFMGKAVNLLLQVEKTKKNVNLVEFDFPPFSDVMSESLAIKPSFITSNKNNYKLSAVTGVDPFVTSLFPLKSFTIKEQNSAINGNREDDDNVGSLFDQCFISFIDMYTEQPYKQIADVLNNVLRKQCGLFEQLDSLSSIYLMLENDLMHSFCEALFQQMDADEPWFDERMMSNTFSEACETSGYDEIVYIKLRGAAENMELRSANKASFLELIDFKVEIPWPLNNFIDKNELSNYSKITSLLLRLKRAKYVMEKKTLFRERKSCKKSDSHTMRFYSLRMKILWFINAFWRYIMTTILHSETIDFRNKLSMSKDADEITALHTLYVRKIVDRCLLNDKSTGIKKSIIHIFDIAEQMANLFNQYVQSYDDVHQTKDYKQFDIHMNNVEKDFNRLNEFISISLMILGKKGNLPWFESLAASLSSQ